MNTFDSYTTLRACFGPEWEPGVRLAGPLYFIKSAFVDDDAARDRLLSAALVELEKRKKSWGDEYDFRSGNRTLFIVATTDNGEPVRSPPAKGTGPDLLSRLCDALTKMKEARDGTV